MGTMLLTTIVIGLIAGCAARTTASDGGRGVAVDLLLGIGGSTAAGLLFHALGNAPDTSVSAMAASAAVGAAAALFAQRYLWPAPLRHSGRAAVRPHR